MQKAEAVLIDAGTGNLHSVENALRSLGVRLLVTSDPHDLLHPGRVILPGVGAFGAFMQGLRRDGLDEAVRDVVLRGDPLFGICVGMQALFEGSEEIGQPPRAGFASRASGPLSGLRRPESTSHRLEPARFSSALRRCSPA